MADLGATGERAQVLLVTALVLGVSFVVLALLLNSAIFTENLASRGETSGAGEAITYQGDLTRSVGTLLTYENRNASNGDNHTEVRNRVGRAVAQLDRILVDRRAKHGSLTNASIVGHSDGARIYQTNQTRNFTDGGGEPDWTVASDITGTRAFRLNISDHDGANRFAVNITEGNDVWRMSVVDAGAGDVEIFVDPVTGSEVRCGRVSEPVEIDITGGTIAGEDCPALSFSDVPTGSYDIAFENASNIEGTYTVIVDDPAIAPPSSHVRFDPPDTDPTVTPAIYNLTLRYEYRTPDLTVVNEIRVAPGESDG